MSATTVKIFIGIFLLGLVIAFYDAWRIDGIVKLWKAAKLIATAALIFSFMEFAKAFPIKGEQPTKLELIQGAFQLFIFACIFCANAWPHYWEIPPGIWIHSHTQAETLK